MEKRLVEYWKQREAFYNISFIHHNGEETCRVLEEISFINPNPNLVCLLSSRQRGGRSQLTVGCSMYLQGGDETLMQTLKFESITAISTRVARGGWDVAPGVRELCTVGHNPRLLYLRYAST